MKIIYFVSILGLVFSYVYAFQCTADQLANPQIDHSQESTSSCIRKILQGGQMEELGKLLKDPNENNKKLLIQALEDQMQRLKKLQGEVILGSSILEPVIKWGQNNSHIFINIKTSHRWDSPPCLNSKKQSVFLNESLLEYINVCVVSHQQITFALKLDLYQLANIIGEKGQNGNLLGFGVTKNGVGMYSAVFEKLEYGIWPFLTKQETTYALWGEIVERHPEDNRKYEELVKSIMRQRRPKSTKDQKSLLICLGLLIFMLLI